MLLKRLVNIALTAVAFSAFSLTAQAAQAKAALESARERMKTIAQDKTSLENKQAAMRKLQRELLDFAYVSEQTLGEKWAKLSPKQKKDFAAALEQLVEASYLGKMRDADTADIEFGEEQTTAEGTEVHATATAQGSEIHLVFKLKAKPQGGWLVTDVVIDDVSLVRNYKAQFQKTLAKASIAELQAKLQKKATELKNTPNTTATNELKTKQL